MMVTEKRQIRCGNHHGQKVYHSDTAEVRMCYQGRLQAYLAAAAPVDSPVDFLSACDGRPAESTYVLRNATEPQKHYIASLLNKHDVPARDAEGIRNRVLAGMSKSEAHSTIDALRKLPERSAPAQTHREPWERNLKADPIRAAQAPWNRLRDAAKDLPDGNYAIDVPGDKAHFYRIARGRNGFVKVQERASETLYPVTGVDRCIEIVQAILAAGVKESGQLYARKLSRCYRCGLLLTDEKNPYYLQGLGPDCGAK